MERKLSDLIPQKNVIKALGTSAGTLLEYRRKGLPYVSLAGKIFFWEDDLVGWISEKLTKITSDEVERTPEKPCETPEHAAKG